MPEPKTILVEYELDDFYKKTANASMSNQLAMGYTDYHSHEEFAGFVKYSNVNFTRYRDPTRGYPTILFSVLEHMVNMPENMVDINAELGYSFQMENSTYNCGLIDHHVSQRVKLAEEKEDTGCGEKLIIRTIPYDSMLESIRVSDEKYTSLVEYVAEELPNLTDIELIGTDLGKQYACDFMCKLLLSLKKNNKSVGLDLSKAESEDFGKVFQSFNIYGSAKDFGISRLILTDVQLFAALYNPNTPWFNDIQDLRVIAINNYRMSKAFSTNLNVNILTFDLTNCTDVHKTFYKYMAVMGARLVVLSLLVDEGKFSDASVDFLKSTYSGFAGGIYAFKDLRLVLNFRTKGEINISMDKLAGKEVLQRVLYIKIIDDIQDIYKSKNHLYVVYLKRHNKYNIECSKAFNVVACSSILSGQAMLVAHSDISIILVNDKGYSVDYRYLL